MGMVVKVVNLADRGVTHLSSMPTLWRQILMHPASVLIKVKQITLDGEIADAALAGC
jgi:hypothetical protein